MERKIKRKFLSMLLVLCMVTAGIPSVSFAADSAVGEVMRLAGTEGTVSVTNQVGVGVAVINNMKLYSGYRITTAANSYAYVSLDSSKVVKLDSSSTVGLQKSGKSLELVLETGSLFFNVKAPLKSDETMNIRTSTMVTGIRGTSGVVYTDGRQVSSLTLLDGSVSVQTRDLVTGQLVESRVEGGQKITASGQAAVAVHVEPISHADVPSFAGAEVAKDPQLQDRITAVDVEQIMTEISKEQDSQNPNLQNIADRSEDIAGSDSIGYKKPEPMVPAQPENPPVPNVPDPQRPPITIDSGQLAAGDMTELLEDAFEDYGIVTVSGTGPLTLADSLTIPEENSLVLQTQFSNAGTLNVEGSLVVPSGYAFTNHGEITNDGELVIDGRFQSYAPPSTYGTDSSPTPTFINSGKLIVRGGFQTTLQITAGGGALDTEGTFINEAEGIVVNTGKFQITPGSNFDIGNPGNWSSEKGVFYTAENSLPLSPEFTDVCRGLGASFFVKTLDFYGGAEYNYVAGKDFQWLIDSHDRGIYLEADSEITGETLSISAGKTVHLYLQDHELTFDGGGIVNRGTLSLAGSKPGFENPQPLLGGSLTGDNTDCLIDNQGTLEVQNLTITLKNPGLSGGDSYTIDNRGMVLPGIQENGSPPLIISNEAVDGWAIFGRSGSFLKNNSSFNVKMDLNSITSEHTLNAPANDSNWPESGDSTGYTRTVVLSSAQMWTPPPYGRSRLRSATPFNALKTATASDAVLPEDQEMDPQRPVPSEAENKSTPSQAVRDEDPLNTTVPSLGQSPGMFDPNDTENFDARTGETPSDQEGSCPDSSKVPSDAAMEPAVLPDDSAKDLEKRAADEEHESKEDSKGEDPEPSEEESGEDLTRQKEEGDEPKI